MSLKDTNDRWPGFPNAWALSVWSTYKLAYRCWTRTRPGR